jgi:hypothetical protein
MSGNLLQTDGLFLLHSGDDDDDDVQLQSWM